MIRFCNKESRPAVMTRNTAPKKWDPQNHRLFGFPDPDRWINRTLLHMGYPHQDSVTEDIMKWICETIPAVKKIVEPAFLFAGEPLVTCDENGLYTCNLQIHSRKWGRLSARMEGERQVCCFALTLGQPSEEKVIKLKSRPIMSGFIWDALLSTLTELYADRAEAYIVHEFSRHGLSAARRFSPGYCDWNIVQGQQALFAFCHPEKIGIRLSASGIMVPRKSVTGVVLAAEKVPLAVPCLFCKKDCNHRRHKVSSTNDPAPS